MCVIACRREQPQLSRVVSFSTRERAYNHAQFFLKPLLTPDSEHPLRAINLHVRGTDMALKL